MKVSVGMITYNHRDFVVAAIEGVLMQRVDFDYELVIGEDCSTDGTREIVLRYQRQYPNKIRVLARKANVGTRENFVETLSACRGQYTALLDGDDFWSSDSKLQKQVDFLERHPLLSMCFHPVKMVFDDDRLRARVYRPRRRRASYDLSDLAQGLRMQASSVLFRTGVFGGFPSWYWRCPVGDQPLYVLLGEHGDIGYLDEVMSVYRVHAGGLSRVRTLSPVETVNGDVDGLRLVIQHLPEERRQPFVRELQKRLDQRNCSIAEGCADVGDLTTGRTYFHVYLRECITSRTVPSPSALKAAMKLYSPTLFREVRSIKTKLFRS